MTGHAVFSINPNDPITCDCGIVWARWEEAMVHCEEVVFGGGEMGPIQQPKQLIGSEILTSRIYWGQAEGNGDAFLKELQEYRERWPILEQQKKDLAEVLQECVEALRLSYNVSDYPADGESIQDDALARARAAIASALGKEL